MRRGVPPRGRHGRPRRAALHDEVPQLGGAGRVAGEAARHADYGDVVGAVLLGDNGAGGRGEGRRLCGRGGWQIGDGGLLGLLARGRRDVNAAEGGEVRRRRVFRLGGGWYGGILGEDHALHSIR